MKMQMLPLIQRKRDGGEMTPDAIWSTFENEYLTRTSPLELTSVRTASSAGSQDELEVGVVVEGQAQQLTGTGNGPIAAFVDAINALPTVDLRRVLRIHYHRLPDWWMRRLARENGEDFRMHVADQRRARMMEWPVEQYYVMLRSARAALRRQISS